MWYKMDGLRQPRNGSPESGSASEFDKRTNLKKTVLYSAIYSINLKEILAPHWRVLGVLFGRLHSGEAALSEKLCARKSTDLHFFRSLSASLCTPGHAAHARARLLFPSLHL